MAGMVVASALVGAVGWDLIDAPETIVKTETKEVTVEVPVEVIKEVPVEVLKEVEVVKTVTDTELVQATCDRLLFDDLAECQSEVKAEDKALKMALSIVEDNDFFDMLEDENIVEDEDEVNVIKVYSDFEDITVIKSDFDDDKYRFEFEVKIEDTDADEKKKVLVNVLVEDGEVELKSVSEI